MGEGLPTEGTLGEATRRSFLGVGRRPHKTGAKEKARPRAGAGFWRFLFWGQGSWLPAARYSWYQSSRVSSTPLAAAMSVSRWGLVVPTITWI